MALLKIPDEEDNKVTPSDSSDNTEEALWFHCFVLSSSSSLGLLASDELNDGTFLSSASGSTEEAPGILTRDLRIPYP
ncbi:hypothetical protein V6N13_089608 [Hibiscus sabdariffa]|uniref:Uncharacterized protein n=1 Tax=Hibiscus sabdariffa TaxID=183260 RepID=A0ABR2QJA8_9ROSI